MCVPYPPKKKLTIRFKPAPFADWEETEVYTCGMALGMYISMTEAALREEERIINLAIRLGAEEIYFSQGAEV